MNFWNLATLAAAERYLPGPPGNLQWINLATSRFDTQATRWDTTTCNGGFRAQVSESSSGFYVKDALSNGAFFQLASRLARYTGNQTYADWASKVYDWTTSVLLIDNRQWKDWAVWQDALISDNCETLNETYWTVNAGLYLYGSAVMYDITKDAIWYNRTMELLARTYSFATEIDINVIVDWACDSPGGNYTCTDDERVYKGIFSRFLGDMIVMAPYTVEEDMRRLNASAIMAAKLCNDQGTSCKGHWFTEDEGLMAVRHPEPKIQEIINALEVVQALLAKKAKNLEIGQVSKGGGNGQQGSGTQGSGQGNGTWIGANGTDTGPPYPIATGFGLSIKVDEVLFIAICGLTLLAVAF